MSRRKDRRRSRATIVEIGRAAIGVAHLAGSRRALGRTAVFSRILGVRQIAQAALLLRSGSAEAHTLGAAVDATHGISMVPLLVLDRRSRRFAWRQFWVALTLTVLEIGLVGPGAKR